LPGRLLASIWEEENEGSKAAMEVAARIWEEEKHAEPSTNGLLSPNSANIDIGSDVLDALHDADPKKVEVVGVGCSCLRCLSTNSTTSQDAHGGVDVRVVVAMVALDNKARV
jgi:hypothetical protein